MTAWLEPWPLPWAAAVLTVAAAVLLAAGSAFTRLVDRLADRTGMGEALAGAVLLGATTSLSGLIVTVLSAAADQPDLAVSNALGGIAAQTAFLAVADLAYRRANLEHAAASLPNLLQTQVLVAMIAVVLLATVGPSLSFAGTHPASALLPAIWLYGLVLTRRARRSPMWRPELTADTREDRPDPDSRHGSALRLWLAFGALGALVALCGVAVGHAGLSLVEESGLSGSLVGGLFTSVVTSLPELVTVLAAVRRGALQLAVGDIVGGNAFDVLFIAAADVAYQRAPIYTGLGDGTLFVLALTLLLTALLAAGLLYRQRRGIGFEGLAILVVYAVGFVLLSGIDGG